MAKQPSKKSTATQWIDGLDTDAIDEARENACTDAYGDYEQHRIDARSVELLPPLPDGHLTLAAYLQWQRFV